MTTWLTQKNAPGSRPRSGQPERWNGEPLDPPKFVFDPRRLPDVRETLRLRRACGPFSITWTPAGSRPFVVPAITYDSNGLVPASREIPVVIANVGTDLVKALYAGLLVAPTLTVRGSARSVARD